MPDNTYPPIYLQPGQSVNLGDVNGNNIDVIGVHDQYTLDFIAAYRELQELTAMGQIVTAASMEYANRKVQKAYKRLPGSVFIEIERRDADAASG